MNSGQYINTHLYTVSRCLSCTAERRKPPSEVGQFELFRNKTGCVNLAGNELLFFFCLWGYWQTTGIVLTEQATRKISVTNQNVKTFGGIFCICINLKH